MQNNADTPDTAASDALASLNFDQAELDKFSALAARWWDPESEFKPLHAINPLRLGWIRDLARKSWMLAAVAASWPKAWPKKKPRSQELTWPTNR